MLIKQSQLLCITVFGLGYLRPAPGTWGSLPPVGMALALAALTDNLKFEILNVLIIDVPLIAMAVAAMFVCLRFGAAAEIHFGKKDASPIVADEVAGQSIALLFLPWRDVSDPNGWKWNIAIAATAFIAFRLMDIIKPPPARSLQRLPGGWGIVVDDLIAAVYAWGLGQMIVRFALPPLAA